VAPVLQCPDCGTKHPIATVPDAPAFACTGCGRALKVPASVPRGAAAAPVVAAAGSIPDAPPAASAPISQPTPIVEPDIQKTAAMPVIEQSDKITGPAEAAPAPPTPIDRSYRKVPWWARLLLWIVAVPVSFIIVFAVARAVGVFTSSQLSDVFLANDSARFWPVARLLPFVALLTACFVQGGVLLLARRRSH
jgi:hypothetical protein